MKHKTSRIPALLFLGLVGTVVASGFRVDASPKTSCSCDVERKQLYLECLHEYNVGSIASDDLTPDEASIACAAWAKVDRP